MSAVHLASRARPTRRAAAWGLAAAPAAGLFLATCGAARADPFGALSRGKTWFNSAPLRPSDLADKVVLVNFWTYTCINSLRPLPYLRTWADRYGDRGLVVLGVHTPEFSFEHQAPRVGKAVADQGVRYPVVLDNDFEIWRSFNNSAWPAFYFVDARGRVRHQRLGEDDYARSERVIQELLGEARGEPVTDPISPVVGEGAQAAPDWADLASPETYVGYAKAENFAGHGRLGQGMAQQYAPPDHLPPNGWALSGLWDVQSECAALAGADGAITFRFHARDLHLVMGPGADGQGRRFRVRIDGVDPGADHGVDVDAEGWGELADARLYQLIRQSGPIRDRTFEIQFLGAGPRAYCFTFG
jgi:thiol-disulfide isomerase/thioredoxin